MPSKWSFAAGKTAAESKSSWTVIWVILLGLAMAAGGAYLVYKYRWRVSTFLYSKYFYKSSSFLGLTFVVYYHKVLIANVKQAFRVESEMDFGKHLLEIRVQFSFDLFYHTFQSYMDSEIRAIMAQYMPLDNQSEVVNHANENRA